MLLDPMINLQFQRMRDELSESEKKLKETQQELEAVQFNAQRLKFFSLQHTVCLFQ
jgi:uncharacterized protein YpuA (DUF1002 family)